MADYNLDRLGNIEFENLVQALSTKIFDNKNIVFGKGKDGAREVTFEGKSKIGNQEFNGYHVVQAKFKDSFESKDWEWAKQQFKNEMKKFEDPKRDLPTPEVYVFFTNIQFTAVSEIGGRDQIEKFKKQYQELIPNILILGCDEIYKLLDNNRDVATTYSSFILTGDILHELYSFMKMSKSNDENILYRFLNREFEEELCSKLEQAGKVTDEKINLEEVFVDLNISGESTDENEDEKFVEFCIKNGNKSWKNKPYKMVFIGGPGQGKSTVTQYLTQIYRVNFLKTFTKKTLSKNVERFKKKIDENNHPTCYRFPIKIILSDYSEWLYKQKKDGLSYTIITYIQNRIEYRADEVFINLRELLSRISFLFIFDGLDEVPSTSNRKDVIIEIDNFVNLELKTVNCDAMIIATTRPQGYSNEFSRENEFNHFELNNMDKQTCIKYLDGLIQNTITSHDERYKQLKILKDALDNDVTADIMKTPLQATIMAILVKSGGKPSKDKFSLFDDYYHTMLKREKQKNILTIISNHEDYINEIHYKLGNKLQISSQNKENTSSLINKDDFQILVKEYFENEGLIKDDIEKYTKEIMEAITERLVFISEKQDNKIGFAIRSTQEYFSAMMNVHNISDEKAITNMKDISQSIYWRNVFIFMIGYITKKKKYMLDYLDSFVGELNGSSLNYEELSLSKLTRYGSLLSLNILSESILNNRPKEENKFINHLDQLTDIISLNNSNHLLEKLKPSIINGKMQSILTLGVQSPKLYIRMSSWNMIAILSSSDNKYFDHFVNYWNINEDEEVFYLKSFIDDNVFTEFILEKSCKYLNWKNIMFYKEIANNDLFFEALVDSKKLEQDKMAKNFLLEVLFFNQWYYSPIKIRSILFFKILGVDTDVTLDFLRSNHRTIGETNSYNILMEEIKDLRDNQLLNNMYKLIVKDKDLSLLTTFFNYMSNPSAKTLKSFFIELKLKFQINGDMPTQGFIFNWQLKYIVEAIHNNLEEDKVFQFIDKFGVTFDDFKHYESELNDLDNIFEKSDILTVKNKLEENYNKNFFKFFEEIYLKNKPSHSKKLLHEFIITFRYSEKKVYPEYVINEVKTIINSDKSKKSKILIELALVCLIGLVKKNEIQALVKDFNIDLDFSFKSITGILGHRKTTIIINNILDLIKFEEKENQFIVIIFNVLSSNYSNINSNNHDFSILFNLEYKNLELKIYGYLSSLVSQNIYTNKNEMDKIKNFLLQNINTYYNIFENTLDIIMYNNLKGNLIENLLLDMYKCINKDSVKNCILISKYENAFQNLFENKVIELH